MLEIASPAAARQTEGEPPNNSQIIDAAIAEAAPTSA
jgi:hypothetical protein